MSLDIQIPEFDFEEQQEKPSKTYRLDLDAGRIVSMTDGLEAVKQAIIKALLTVRFDNLIYDDDYGCEVGNVLHDKNVTPEYLETAIPEMIKDVTLQDSRIIDVYDFKIDFANDSAHISFMADTIFGKAEISKAL